MQTDTERRTKQGWSATAAWGAALLLVSIAVITFALVVAGRRATGLSQFEQLLFSVLTLLLSTAGAVLIAEHYARRQGVREYQQLARPALRRVVELQAGIAHVGEYLIERRGRYEEQTPEPAVVQEWLDGALSLLNLHAGQLNASVADWQ